MGKGSSAGVVRVPNISTGPLLIITGNIGPPGIPATGPGTSVNATGPANQYTSALMWEANGFKNWSFSVQGQFAPCTITVWGTYDQRAVVGVNTDVHAWFTLNPSIQEKSTISNPMNNPGDYFEFDRALRAIAVTVNNFTGTFPVNFFSEATP